MNYLLLTLGLIALPLFAAVLFAAWNYLFGPRVIRLLINKYLRKRRIAWVSLIAVTLCTAMVIVVISVMGGWLRMFRESFHGVSGDIIVSKQSMAGFPYYDEMIDQIQKIDGVNAAVPMIQTFGLVNIANQIQYGVEVTGLPLEKIDSVSGFRQSLYRQWQMASDPDLLADMQDGAKEIRQLAKDLDATAKLVGFSAELQQLVDHLEALEQGSRSADLAREKLPQVTQGLVQDANAVVSKASGAQIDPKMLDKIEEIDRRVSGFQTDVQKLVIGGPLRKKPATFDLPNPPDYYRDLKSKAKVDVSKWPGMIVGVGVVGIQKDKDGHTHGRDFLYDADVKLTVLALKDQGGGLNADQVTPHPYWIVDDSRTKIWQIDEHTVYVPLEVVQQDLQMNEYTPPGGTAEDKEPARVTHIQIGLKPGYDMYEIKPKVQEIVKQVLAQHNVSFAMDNVRVQTWEEVNAKFLHAVENEKSLVTILFGIISIVAIFLIFCIFFMIVVEKTRDIGIIKSIGATSNAVAWIFLGYGVTIGVVGGGCGLLAGYLIVHYINELHSWIAHVTGAPIWDPETYAFDTIPNTMNPREVTVIVAVAILASLLGALVPAIRAARMHPIEALRWE